MEAEVTVLQRYVTGIYEGQKSIQMSCDHDTKRIV